MRWFDRLLDVSHSVLRNRDFLSALARVHFAPTDDERRERLNTIRTWVDVRLEQANRRARFANAKGFAALLVSENGPVREHLRSVSHFGVLADLTDRLYSREDYVLDQFALQIELKEAKPGLGLGSPCGSAALDYEGQPLTGLELLQTWCVLSNLGHLWGTFATERAVLFEMTRDSAFQTAFLSEINEELRPAITEIVQSRSLYRFVNALSAWRVARLELDPAISRTLNQALFLYHESSSSQRIRRLRRIYRMVRRVAYLLVHGHVGIEPEFPKVEPVDAVMNLLSLGEIGYEDFAPPSAPLAALLNAIDTYQYETFFTGQASAARVLAHLRSFKKWWHSPDRSPHFSGTGVVA